MSTELPSLFGRATTIFRDHQDLARTLRRLRTLCAALEARQAMPLADVAPARLLVELRTWLGEHFIAEESEDYFGVVRDEAPELAHAIGRLVEEHAEMLQTLDALARLARDPSGWSRLPEPVRGLMERLERHEHAESALLRRLFADH